MKRKTDGRKNNSRPNTGLTEAQLLVKGPEELFEQMKERAAADGVSVREVWRRAAAAYIARG